MSQKPILLCTIGSSPWVAPEAAKNNDYHAVYGLTSAPGPLVKEDPTNIALGVPEKRNIELQIKRETQSKAVTDWFLQNSLPYTLFRIEHFTDLKSTQDHDRFEEILARLFLHLKKKHPEHPFHVCLAGGFKTMSSSLQKWAHILGADELFHVLCDSNPDTLEKFEKAFLEDRILHVHMGSEQGWGHLSHQITCKKYPLCFTDHSSDDTFWKWINLPDHQSLLVSYIRDIQERSNASESTERMPFPCLNYLDSTTLDWLEQPLTDSNADKTWLSSIPKIELHTHLGGFATHGAILDDVRNAAKNDIPEKPTIPPIEHWPEPQEPIPLDNYMRLGDANGSSLLKDPGCLRKQCELFYQHLVDERVMYAEIRCSPNNYTTSERSAWTVLEDIRSAFNDCMQKSADASGIPACHVNLIIIATRKQEGDLSDIARHLSLAVTANQHVPALAENKCRVVGVDLAGFENKETRAVYFSEDFKAIHRCGLAVTAHAGENDDAEGIWQAVYHLHARRIGHGLRLLEAKDLLNTMVERRIGVEMCPYANYQIKGFSPMPEQEHQYPLLEYLKRGIPVSINTDNIGISAASLTKNLSFLATLTPGITRMQILRLQYNAIVTSFADFNHRKRLLHQFDLRLRTFFLA